jgi:UDP-N-acetylmuramoyl-tripeptide--D-alanyl-D-alanine ligase
VHQAACKGAAGIVVRSGFLGRRSGGGDSESLKTSVVIEVADTLEALGELARWWRQSHQVRVVAITGSAGKTTTKEMVACILEQSHHVLKNQGNFNNLIGLPLSMVELGTGHDMAVLEMGMNRSGEIGRLTEIAAPDVGVITNVGKAHLEGLGDIQGVARAKVEMVEKMSPKGKVILNGDDRLLMKTAAVHRKDLVTFGLNETCEFRADHIQDRGVEGISFDLRHGKDVWPVKLRVPGLQNVFNALAAGAAGLCLGEPPEHMVEGLARFEGVKGRFTVIPLREDVLLVDDTYNANPSSLEAALEALGSLAKGKRRTIVGLGEMLELGKEAGEAHLEAGRRVAKLDPAYFLAMGEHAGEMIRGALMGGMSDDRVEAAETREHMVKRIKEEFEKGDLIFLKGSRRMGLDKVVEELKSMFQAGGIDEGE